MSLLSLVQNNFSHNNIRITDDGWYSCRTWLSSITDWLLLLNMKGRDVVYPRSPKYVTPTKSAKPKCCASCGKSSQGHLKNMHRNVAMQCIYKELLVVLDIDLSAEGHGLVLSDYICDSCVTLMSRIKDLKNTCRKNLELYRAASHSQAGNTAHTWDREC